MYVIYYETYNYIISTTLYCERRLKRKYCVFFSGKICCINRMYLFNVSGFYSHKAICMLENNITFFIAEYAQFPRELDLCDKSN